MAMIYDFQKGDLPLFRLNFGTVILLPKKEDAIQIQQYRPICLLNVNFKIFTKIATLRISKIAHTVIKPTQTAFMPGRHILEGVVVLHETIHELKSKNMDGVIFKIDFEKSYDKVNWNFLKQALRMKGFHTKWIDWIDQFISKDCVGVKVNDDISHYFQTQKGLRQGDRSAGCLGRSSRLLLLPLLPPPAGGRGGGGAPLASNPSPLARRVVQLH